MLEPKGNGENAKRIVKLVNKYHLQKRVLFESFSDSALSKLARLAPEIPRTQLAGSYKAIGRSQDFAASFYLVALPIIYVIKTRNTCYGA